MTKQIKPKAKSQPKAPAVVEAPKRETKQAIIINLLKREEGATLHDLIKATEWKPHSVRGHLSNLRKKQGGGYPAQLYQGWHTQLSHY